MYFIWLCIVYDFESNNNFKYPFYLVQINSYLKFQDGDFHYKETITTHAYGGKMVRNGGKMARDRSVVD